MAKQQNRHKRYIKITKNKANESAKQQKKKQMN